MSNIAVSIVLTAHREGLLTGPTVNSLKAALRHYSQNSGDNAEVIVVLDRSDSLTEDSLRYALDGVARFYQTDCGDPGQARNAGIQRAIGRFSTFLDADDLWSENWITEATKRAMSQPIGIYHSHCNVIFGDERNIWWHIDSDSPLFDPLYLRWANYWDAMSFAETAIFRRIPFRPIDLRGGFGHEDWDWNCLTIDANIPHKAVYGTIHYKRRRAQSQMAQVASADCVVRPD